MKKMKRVFIIHGWSGSPDEPMLRWLRRQLEENGFGVIAPEMPSPDTPEIGVWIERLKRAVKNPDEQTYFIGHSIGCQAILRYLEKLSLSVKIGGVIFIAPWINLKPESLENEEAEKIAKPWLETPVNFDRVKMRFKQMVCIFSDNDPFVPLSDKDIFKERLNSEIIVEHKKGHYDPDSKIINNQTALSKLLEISQ